MKKQFLLILVAGTLIAADAPKDDAAKAELKKLEGKWVLASGQRDGLKIADDDVKKSKIVWKGKECELEMPHQSKETIRATIVTLDPTKSPKEMSWTRSAGPDAGKTHHAIYEITSENEYRVCFAPAGKERPKDFKAEAGSGHLMHVWKRAKQ